MRVICKKEFNETRFSMISSGIIFILILIIIGILFFDNPRENTEIVLSSSNYEESLKVTNDNFERLKAQNEYLISRIDDLQFKLEQQETYVGDLKEFWKGLSPKARQ
jgi:hypothetical protein